jgi:hypothetical protein
MIPLFKNSSQLGLLIGDLDARDLVHLALAYQEQRESAPENEQLASPVVK